MSRAEGVDDTESTAGFRIELPEGSLDIHDLSVGEPAPQAPVVLAVHGITANGLSWVCVADELFRRRGPGSVRFLAPDLRGRAGSRQAPGPYGLGTHADDVLAIADAFAVKPVLVGHSMGAFVTALACSRAPERVAGSVLLDGGFTFPPPPDLDVDAAITAVSGPAMTRLSMRFASPDAYLEFWREHPAVGPALDGPQASELRRYLLHDLVKDTGADGTGAAWVSSCVLDAVRADGADVLAHAEAHAAAARAAAAGVVTEFVWAQRGLFDEAQGLYDEQRIAALGLPDAIQVTPAPGTNHYTLVLGRAGASVVVDAIERRLDGV
ncbi:alpha/beta fold hydrolase [Lapillicoccus sp.]|uniref:alpha/beta fold hydrolase n=1 Tax=Lapillicoccus sp. TaxID=1909287 RepID=UPI0032630299